MNVSTITAPGRIADPVAQTNLPPAPPQRPLPAVTERPAAAGNEIAPAKGDRSRELETELAAANRKLADMGHQLHFQYDREANELIVLVVDLGTQKVLRQYPSDEALRVARLVKSGRPLINMQA